MSRFLITGLPRSRTAWWAVVTGAAHEIISQEGRKGLWWPMDKGISDSGAAPELPLWIDCFAPRTLIIERPKIDVLHSLGQYVGSAAMIDWRKVDALIDAALRGLEVQHPLIKRVDYSDLDSIGTVRSCLDWLEVKEPTSLEQLMHMNIQSDLAWNIALYKQKAA